MSEGKTQNINITGGNIAGLQVGDNNTQTITQNIGGGPTPEAVFEAIKPELPPEVVEDTVEPLQMMACMSAAEQETPENKAKAANLYERLAPYAPQIAKGLATFGAAALGAVASSNPVVAGLLAVCKATNAGGGAGGGEAVSGGGEAV